MELDSALKINNFITSFEQSFNTSVASSLNCTPENHQLKCSVKTSSINNNRPENFNINKFTNSGSKDKSKILINQKNDLLVGNSNKMELPKQKLPSQVQTSFKRSNIINNDNLPTCSSWSNKKPRQFMEFKTFLKHEHKNNNNFPNTPLKTPTTTSKLINKQSKFSSITHNEDIPIISLLQSQMENERNSVLNESSNLRYEIDELSESQNRISQELIKINAEYENLSDIDKLILYEELKLKKNKNKMEQSQEVEEKQEIYPDDVQTYEEIFNNPTMETKDMDICSINNNDGVQIIEMNQNQNHTEYSSAINISVNEINLIENEAIQNKPKIDYLPRRITRSMTRSINNMPEDSNSSLNSTSNFKTSRLESRKNTKNMKKNLKPKIPTNRNLKLKIQREIFGNCLLFNDNLLKNLYEERYGCKFRLEKNKYLVEEPFIVKRYKQNNMKILKLKNYFKKKNTTEEDKLEKFLEKCSGDQFTPDILESETSFDRTYDSALRIPTPSTYETDVSSDFVHVDKLTETELRLLEGINKLSKHTSLLFDENEDVIPKEYQRKSIINLIDKYLENILNEFSQGRKSHFCFPRKSQFNCSFENGRYVLNPNPKYTIVFPSNAANEIKFNTILFIMNKIKYLLESNTKLTHREIFYQLKTLGLDKTQRYTDDILQSISKMLNVGLWALNITAQKGLVYGNLKLLMTDGTTIHCNVPGTLIPQNVMEIAEIHFDAYFILVVEKEAIFHKLLEEGLPNKLVKPFILITGKGFPDVNTQLFLRKLWMLMRIPVFIIVDADPDGIAIMLQYRFGSMTNAHISDYLAVPKAKWLGVFPTEIQKFSLTSQSLTSREKNRISNLLNMDCVKANENIKLQLNTLLKHGVKCGIESLIKSSMFLSNFYMSWKMYSSDFI